MQHQVLIGNYLTTAPNGIAFVVEDGNAAFLVDTGWPYYAGEAAPDDSYHVSRTSRDGANVTFCWGRSGDAVIGQFDSDKPVRIDLKLSQTWPDIKTVYEPTPDGATATSNGVAWSLRVSPKPSSTSDKMVTVDIVPGQPACFLAGIGNVGMPNPANIGTHLLTKGHHYEETKPRASGDWGDFLGAIADNLNNSRLYSTDNRMLAISVSRGWAGTPNSAPYFCWDSFFNGNLACLDDPKTARDTVRAILSCQTGEGLVPNFGHWNFDGGRVSTDRSQPPVGSMCIWRMQERWPDLAFLKEVYPKLVTWHRWWAKARDGNHNGLLEWGSATGQLQGAKWETGWDDTVHFESAKMVGPNMDADAVDLNSMWAMDAEFLSRIAKAIGDKDEAKAFAREHDEICARINKELWNPALGIYCSKLWDGQFLTRLTPMNFYPLLAGAATPERARQVLAVMTDPKRFWGDWILPTVAYDDPVWPQQDYWKGKVWAPVNYLVFQGLRRYASPDVIDEFAQKSVSLFMRNWTAKGVCGENYLSKDGTQSSDSHYTWGALLCLVGLESIVHTEPDGRIWLNGTLQAHLELNNVPLNGHRYRVEVIPGKTVLSDERGNRVLITAEGKIAIERLP